MFADDGSRTRRAVLCYVRPASYGFFHAEVVRSAAGTRKGSRRERGWGCPFLPHFPIFTFRPFFLLPPAVGPRRRAPPAAAAAPSAAAPRADRALIPLCRSLRRRCGGGGRRGRHRHCWRRRSSSRVRAWCIGSFATFARGAVGSARPLSRRVRFSQSLRCLSQRRC